MSTLWKIYRWKLFFAVNLLLLLLLISLLDLRLYSLNRYLALYKPIAGLSIPLSIIGLLSITGVMRYFREDARAITVAYIYIFCSTILAIAEVVSYTPFMASVRCVFLLLYSIFSLLAVKAPEVSGYFKFMAWVNILGVLLTLSYQLLYRTQHFVRTMYFNEVRFFILTVPHILLLLILYKMMYLPQEYYSPLEKEIDSIGEMT